MELIKKAVIAVASITKDQDMQQRLGKPNAEYLYELSEVVREAEERSEGEVQHPFVPIRVVWDGDKYWLFDGFYRTAAYEMANMPAINAEIYSGTREDAEIASYGQNSTHGLKRTNAEKRRTVVKALNNPALEKKTRIELAKICGVTRAYIYQIEKEMADDEESAEDKLENIDDDGVIDEEVEEIATETEILPPITDISAIAEIAAKGDVPESVEELVMSWRILITSGLSDQLKAKREMFRNVKTSNPIKEAVELLANAPTPNEWKVCDKCEGNGDIDGVECDKCTGGILIQ